MGQILNMFFEQPTRNFHIRELSRILNIPKTTVSYHINDLLKKEIVIKQKKGTFTSFKANETSELYRFYKRQAFLKKIIQSKLLDHLEAQTTPKCIILFGSFAKAEHNQNSDIDLFIQAKETKIDLKKFEKHLKHKINILFEENPKNLSPELLNNIINGIKLRGFLKIR
ncbi:MAG: nucleotidyltransferase domain-containing protein [Nanoarchaeota archaeon]|nr:nucleotidyltransferase domain-containing protein [DPANN group archaeon]MBL7116858.1 nucleotidyltransferase domain-containing protein [Nanoarchaeota archaeon]